jgi:hypothetical protein
MLTQGRYPSEDKTSVRVRRNPFIIQVGLHQSVNVFTDEWSGKLAVGIVVLEATVEIPVYKLSISVDCVISYL